MFLDEVTLARIC